MSVNDHVSTLPASASTGRRRRSAPMAVVASQPATEPMTDEQIEQADATASALVAELERRIRTIEATPVQDRSPGQFDEVRVLRAKLAISLAKLLPLRRASIDRLLPAQIAAANARWERERMANDPRVELEAFLQKIGDFFISIGADPALCKAGGGMAWFSRVNREVKLIVHLAELESKVHVWADARRRDGAPPGESMKQAAEQGFQALQQYAQRVARAAEGLAE